MRNYIAELKSLGFSTKELVEQTGFSASKLSRLKSGSQKLHSGTADYEIIRNTSRRLAYKISRKTESVEAASASRRALPNPVAEAIETRSVRVIKARQDTTRFQLKILAKFRNEKTKETRFQNGFSFAYLVIDKDIMTGEAVREAQSKLGGSNWLLQRIISRQIIEYKLSNAKTT
ncbi:MAG: hypothetical protein KKD11_08500 [Candidatus Omnitrophica bacterium]|nr:hypothetical protein [Candidatus Omnitrophota bacterium]